MKPQTRIILDQKKVSSRGRLLSLEKQEDFIPGQVLGLALDSRMPPRWYSIASGKSETAYTILYTPFDDGVLTPPLEAKKAGDELMFYPPRGIFVDPIEAKSPALSAESKIWWIANGTGIAPFHSMALSGKISGHRLVHGSFSREEAWFSEDFIKLEAESKDFKYIPCLSREDKPWTSHTWNGRLTSWLKGPGLAEMQAQDYFLLCGSAAMIVEVRELLFEKGISYERIISETYF